MVLRHAPRATRPPPPLLLLRVCGRAKARAYR
jgi:hypothetical protein